MGFCIKTIVNALLCIYLLFFVHLASAKSSFRFHFRENPEGWSQWGNGMGRYDSAQGRSGRGGKLGSLALSNQFGQEHTWYKKFSGLKAGTYKVSAFIKGSGIRQGKWRQSFWAFFRTTGEIHSALENIYGDFAWSKLSYTAEVGANGVLELWFRLKTVGKVWVDDIKIHPYSGKNRQVSFIKSTAKAALPTLHPIKGKSARTTAKTATRKKIFDSEIVLPWSEYYNFPLAQMQLKLWPQYDYISLQVTNPGTEILPFVLVLGDEQSQGYWNQLNHYTQLAPGVNHLRFSLRRSVGERGSVSVARPLNLQKIKKFFIAIGAESQELKKIKVTVANISLENLATAKFFPGLVALDFVNNPKNAFPGFIPITTQDFYHPILKLGFSDFTEFWRVHDSTYADLLHRDAILPIKGGFNVDLPNGKYTVRLVANYLGDWDVPFHHDRHIEMQGETVFHESRRGAIDYIKDYLQFELVEPTRADNPYQLYLKKIFRPIEKVVEVKNGQLYIEFASDPSGIGLNSLLIWPLAKEAQGRAFVAELEKSLSHDFANKIRKIAGRLTFQKDPITLVAAGQSLTFNNIRGRPFKKLSFAGGLGAWPTKVLKIGPFTKDRHLHVSTKDKKILIRRTVNQFVGHELNHETFELAPRFLKEVTEGEKIFIQKNNILYLWLQYPIKNKWRKKTYRSTLTLTLDKLAFKYPLRLKVLPYSLPKVPISVGFLGLNPMKFSYYRGPEIKRQRMKWAKLALKTLLGRGFTTWSGLPAGELHRSGSEIQLQTAEIDELFSYAKKLGFTGKVFSYGGDFLAPLLHGTIAGRPSEWSYEKYLKKISLPLKKKMASWPAIIYSYSDEPTGYQNRLDEDIKFGKLLKKHLPHLQLGGFVPMQKSSGKIHQLYDVFDEGSYANYLPALANKFKKQKKKWGIYNAAPRSFDDPRYSYGLGLYRAYQLGLSHRLGWHFSGFNNYPYYDLDGRESDAAMLYPTSDGKLLSSIKFELASLGLQEFRSLLLAEKLAKQGHKELQKYLQKMRKNLHNLPENFLSLPGQQSLDLLINNLLPKFALKKN